MGRWSPTVIEQAPEMAREHPLAGAIRFGAQMFQQDRDYQMERLREERQREYQAAQIEQMKMAARRADEQEARALRAEGRLQDSALRSRNYSPEDEVASGTSTTTTAQAPTAPAVDPELQRMLDGIEATAERLFPGTSGMVYEQGSDGRRWVRDRRREWRESAIAKAHQDYGDLVRQREVSRAGATAAEASLQRAQIAANAQTEAAATRAAAMVAAASQRTADKTPVAGPRRYKQDRDFARDDVAALGQQISTTRSQLSESDMPSQQRPLRDQLRRLNEAHASASARYNSFLRENPNEYVGEEALPQVNEAMHPEVERYNAEMKQQMAGKTPAEQQAIARDYQQRIRRSRNAFTRQLQR